MVRSMNCVSEANARISQLEAALQQNLLKMQQMRQFLEAAQERHQHQLLIETQDANGLNTPQEQQQMTMEQHVQDIKARLFGSIAEGGIGSFVGQQQNQQQ
ncbi:hypothetical protein CEXT_414211 [Caerostris extrusa]|uniref:Uncharacterized protein n=1 Tax=Caerostris extrusa TaxID=172846 RepID=A0AAV4U4Q0_CAEEX|nr:hypothetical protein CEXT_414211 [Caerostris extrusa]